MLKEREIGLTEVNELLELAKFEANVLCADGNRLSILLTNEKELEEKRLKNDLFCFV